MTGYVFFLAHGALAGIGAYATIIAMNAGVPLWLAVLAGAAAAILSSLVIGITSLRLRGIAFTFATLFFQALIFSQSANCRRPAAPADFLCRKSCRSGCLR